MDDYQKMQYSSQQGSLDPYSTGSSGSSTSSGNPGNSFKRPSFCSNCGAKLTGVEKFCGECGQAVRWAAISPPPSPTPSPSATSSAPTPVREAPTKPVVSVSPEKALQDAFTKAQEYWDKGDNDNALQTLLGTLPAAPGNASLLNRIGLAYRRKEDFDKAIEYYKKAIEIQEDPLFISNLAMAYYYKGSLNQGLAYMEDAIKKVEPKPADYDKGLIHSNYALLIGKAGNLHGARDNLKKAEKCGYPRKNCETVWGMLLGN